MKSSILLPRSQSLVLSNNKMLRYSVFILLYFAQGIFEGFTLYSISVWMAANGKTAGEIAGFTAILLIPWSFKFLLGPLVDRFTFLSMGRKRPWIIFAQLGIFFSFLAFSFLSNPLENFTSLIVIGFCLSFFTTFQDIATDGLAIEVTPQDEQAKVNALMWGSKVVAISLWLAAGTWLINTFGFQRAVLFPAAAVFAIALVVIFLRENAGEKRMPWSVGSASAVSKTTQPESWKVLFKTILKMMTIRTSIWFMALMVLLQIVYNLINTLNTIFIVQELNWTESDTSNWIATSILISGIIGLFFGGFLIKRLGKSNVIKYGFWFIALICAGMFLAQAYWQNTLMIKIFTLCFYIANTLITISIFAIAMTICLKSIAASQFTVYMAMGNVGYMLGAKLLGVLKERFDWSMIFVATACVSLFALFVFWQLEKALTRQVTPDPMAVPII